MGSIFVRADAASLRKPRRLCCAQRQTPFGPRFSGPAIEAEDACRPAAVGRERRVSGRLGTHEQVRCDRCQERSAQSDRSAIGGA